MAGRTEERTTRAIPRDLTDVFSTGILTYLHYAVESRENSGITYLLFLLIYCFFFPTNLYIHNIKTCR